MRHRLLPKLLCTASLLVPLSACVEREGGKADDTGAPPTDDAATPGESADSASPDGSTEPDPWMGACDTELDTDCDMLSDAQEGLLGTDPSEPDTDGDSLPDGLEVFHWGTHPLCSDTDGDGIDDGTEVAGMSAPGSSPLDPDDPSATAAPAPRCADTLPDALYDLTADPDGDGLSTLDELDCLSEPLVADTDGDGLSDGTECGTACLAGEADTDGDGLDDGDEATAGTACDQLDTDGDGLSDGDEVLVHLCDPLSTDGDDDGLGDLDEVTTHAQSGDPQTPANCMVADADGDGLEDGIEALLDGFDPRVADDTSRVVRPGVVASCVDPAVVEEEFNFGDGDYYPASSAEFYEVTEGPECRCTFDVVHPTPVYVKGVEVFADQRIHQGTNWADAPLPRGVLIAAPAWDWPTPTHTAPIGDVVLSESTTDLSATGGYWNAYTDAAAQDAFTSTRPVEVVGSVDLRVSYVNTNRQEIGDHCGVLGGVTHDDGTELPGLQLLVEVEDPATTGPPGLLPDHDPRSCRPGPPSRDRYALLPTGRSAVPAPLGDGALAGAVLRTVTVVDWRGADRLELQGPEGQWILTPEAPAVALPAPGPSAAALHWTSHRAAEGRYADPVVELETACDAPPAALRPAALAGYQAGWAHLSRLAAAAGLSGALTQQWPGADLDDHSAFRLRLSLPGPDASPHAGSHLRVDVAGAEVLAFLPLTPRAGDEGAQGGATAKAWDLAWSLGGLQLQGALETEASGLRLQVDALGAGADPSPLEPPLVLHFASE